MRELAFATITLVVWLQLLSSVQCQDRPSPERMPHPETGAEGSWVPLWLEQEHVKDDAELEACRRDVEDIETLIALREEEVAALRLALSDQELATAEARKAAIGEPPPTWPLWTSLAIGAATLIVTGAALIR